MSTTIDATFDGEVFRPATPVALSPNTPVRLTIETLPVKDGQPYAFFQLARELKLKGPPDWSENLDDYLYGDKS